MATRFNQTDELCRQYSALTATKIQLLQQLRSLLASQPQNPPPPPPTTTTILSPPSTYNAVSVLPPNLYPHPSMTELLQQLASHLASQKPSSDSHRKPLQPQIPLPTVTPSPSPNYTTTTSTIDSIPPPVSADASTISTRPLPPPSFTHTTVATNPSHETSPSDFYNTSLLASSIRPKELQQRRTNNFCYNCSESCTLGCRCRIKPHLPLDCKVLSYSPVVGDALIANILQLFLLVYDLSATLESVVEDCFVTKQKLQELTPTPRLSFKALAGNALTLRDCLDLSLNVSETSHLKLVRKVFDQISVRAVIFWDSMLHCSAQSSNPMPTTSFSLGVWIKSWIKLNFFNDLLNDEIGINLNNVLVGHMLLSFCGKFGELSSVKKVFDNMFERDVIFWVITFLSSALISNFMLAISLYLGNWVRSWVKLMDQMPYQIIAIWNALITRCANYQRKGGFITHTYLHTCHFDVLEQWAIIDVAKMCLYKFSCGDGNLTLCTFNELTKLHGNGHRFDGTEHIIYVLDIIPQVKSSPKQSVKPKLLVDILVELLLLQKFSFLYDFGNRKIYDNTDRFMALVDKGGTKDTKGCGIEKAEIFQATTALYNCYQQSWLGLVEQIFGDQNNHMDALLQSIYVLTLGILMNCSQPCGCHLTVITLCIPVIGKPRTPILISKCRKFELDLCNIKFVKRSMSSKEAAAVLNHTRKYVLERELLIEMLMEETLSARHNLKEPLLICQAQTQVKKSIELLWEMMPDVMIKSIAYSINFGAVDVNGNADGVHTTSAKKK